MQNSSPHDFWSISKLPFSNLFTIQLSTVYKEMERDTLWIAFTSAVKKAGLDY